MFADLLLASDFPQDKPAFIEFCKERTKEIMDYNTSKKEGCLPCLAKTIEFEWKLVLDEFFPELSNAKVEVIIGEGGKSYAILYHEF